MIAGVKIGDPLQPWARADDAIGVRTERPDPREETNRGWTDRPGLRSERPSLVAPRQSGS